MRITPSLVEAYLKCPMKCFLSSVGETGSESSYDRWVRTENDAYRHVQEKRLVDEAHTGECLIRPRGIKSMRSAKWHLALDVTLRQKNMESDIHAVKKTLSGGKNPSAHYIPFRFFFANRLTRNDKLLLAFDALLLAGHLGFPIAQGEIIHGDHHTPVRVKTTELMKEVRRTVGKMDGFLSSGTRPDFFLNRHCGECEYRTRCNQEAVEKDDLSLLAGMTEKERKTLNSRGIFTVTHLSYAFRPRRRSKQHRDRREKYHNSLKALAIREQKVHVVGSDELRIEGTPVYVDVEANTDLGFYYLIGILIRIDHELVQHSLWADAQGDEERIWRDFINIISKLHDPVIIHYGSFETDFLKTMRHRYGGPDEESAAGKAMDNAINILSLIFAKVYFPTYSNGLKDIGRYLGFGWSEENPSGLKTILWRSEWEKAREPSLKERLITYNAEDCEALRGTTEFVRAILAPGNKPTRNQEHVVQADTLPRRSWHKWRKTQYAMPALDEIGKAAYWDYQQEKIILRFNQHLKKVKRATARHSGSKHRVNKVIQLSRPDVCIRCGRPKPYQHCRYSKEVIDINFGRSGIKRWITTYIAYRYQCPACRAVFTNCDRPWEREKYGRNLLLLCAYLNIDLRIPQKRITVLLKEIFGFDFSNSITNRSIEKTAALYKPTYERLLDKVTNGKLIHADETTLNLEGKTGYVWVFASLEDVVYIYAPSREGDLAQKLLKDFKGVLVTDFYTAYESIPCPQQKCLLHLIRDLNDELMKEPFNEEMKGLVADFADLLKPMVQTVSRFGLKARFLKKHKKCVERFFKNLSRRTYHTETAVRCKARFEKNRSTLFTFLDYDGVPWNNNNAEHAIKAMALLRRNLGGLTTERAIGDYLVLLSVCETCRFKGVSFLDFLRSGEEGIDAYVHSQTWRGKKAENTKWNSLHLMQPPSPFSRNELAET